MGKGKRAFGEEQKVLQFGLNVELREIDPIAIFGLFCREGFCGASSISANLLASARITNSSGFTDVR